MEKTKILPGELLVTKGALKLNSSLPEVGLKDVSPNGSWLEQKQIQAALEARKQLIEVERIEKSGVLSHAEWNEELMLAEVTQKVGGYWQYLGHNVGIRLFLNPEEALFLMEVNCLLVTYNEVKISLQQAYALMLRSNISLMQYKVYASLSRLGYRVFRHQRQLVPEHKENEQRIDKDCDLKKNTDNQNCENNDNVLDTNSSSIFALDKTVSEIDPVDKNNETETDNSSSKLPEEEPDIPMDNASISLEKTKTSQEIKKNVVADQASTSGNLKKVEAKMNKLENSKYIQYKIDKLKSRKYKTKDANVAHNDYFRNMPEFTKNLRVNITAPDQRYLPDKIYLKNNSYLLNVENIRTKSTTPEEMPTTSSSNRSINTAYANNASHLRQPPSHSYRGNNWAEYVNFRFSSQPNPFRQYNFWRPQTSLNYFQFNMTFQRPLLYPQFGPRIMLNPFLQPFMSPGVRDDISFNNNSVNRKKRSRAILKQEHFASIQRLATFVKNSILQLRLSDHNVSKLNHLIQTYNTRYKTRLRLSDDFNIITDENIIDTIEVDDDEEQIAKKPRKVENPDAVNDKLQRLKQLAYQLKGLEVKNEATSRHRRMFSHLLKRFNNAYSVDYYVNDNYDVINRNDLTVLSSSDSEAAAKTPKINRRKKLKNPFSIFKQISEKHMKEKKCADTSLNTECPFKYSETTVNTFKKDWLPDESDFGRAEIVSKDFSSEVIDTRREEFLLDFMKIQPDKFKNWLDIKISFLQCLQETCELFHYDVGQKNRRLESLVKPEEFNDTALVLKKLSIFESSNTSFEETDLTVDFDVYNRDVQNFKKSNRPSPHFRVICIKESSRMPSGANVASLHSTYKDNVAIVFAVVGIGSISYLQVNPGDLPVYVSSNVNNTV